MSDDKLKISFEDWMEINLNGEKYAAYEGRMKRILDEEAAIREAELRLEKAEEALNEAREKARETAREEAKAQVKEEIAQRILKDGYSVEDVAKFTGLEKTRIKELQREL